MGAAATSFLMLVIARACQGAFGAFMAPSALSRLTTTFGAPKDVTTGGLAAAST